MIASNEGQKETRVTNRKRKRKEQISDDRYLEEEERSAGTCLGTKAYITSYKTSR
jgi:hypothetical protein